MIRYKTCARAIGALVHKCDPCDTPENGRVRSLVLIKKGTQITIPLTLTEWQSGIEAGTIIIIPRTSGSFDGGTPKTGDGYGDETERVLSKDYVLSVKDPDFAENAEFWENAEGEVWNVAWRTETKLWYVKADCKLSVKAPVEEGLDTRVVWNVEIKWNSKAMPKIIAYTTIASLFQCHEVVESSESSESSEE